MDINRNNTFNIDNLHCNRGCVVLY